MLLFIVILNKTSVMLSAAIGLTEISAVFIVTNGLEEETNNVPSVLAA